MPNHKIRFEVVHDGATSGTSEITTTSIVSGDMIEANFLVNVTVVTGTNPLLDVVPQTSNDNSAWYDIPGASRRMSAVSKEVISLTSNLGKFLRCVLRPGGTTPVFTTKITLEAKS